MNLVTAIGTAIVTLALIGAVAVLTWHGSIDGQAAIAFFAGIAGVGTAAGVSHVATTTGARAANSRRDGGSI